MPEGGYSIKLRFRSEEDAIEWFEEARHDDLVRGDSGLRLQELSDVASPAEDTRLIVSSEPAEQHPWLVEPVQSTASREV